MSIIPIFKKQKKNQQHVQMLLLREAHLTLAFEVFIGGWSYWHTLLRLYQNYRLSEERQVFSINYLVCTTVEEP